MYKHTLCIKNKSTEKSKLRIWKTPCKTRLSMKPSDLLSSFNFLFYTQ